MTTKIEFNFKNKESLIWYPGGLQSPQAYQWMRRESQQLALCYLTIATPWYWGITNLELDDPSLATGIIHINALKAIFPDGSRLERLQDSKPLKLDISHLKEKFKDKVGTLYLAVLKYDESGPNVGIPLSRYEEIKIEQIVNENNGKNPIKAATLSLRAFLITEDPLPHKYSGFPLLKVTFKDNIFIKTSFIPPTTHVDQDSTLGRSVGDLIKNLRDKVSFMVNSLKTLSSENITALFQYYKNILDNITDRLGILECLYSTNKVHPILFYQQLGILAALCSTFERGQSAPIFDSYDHNDLEGSFQPMLSFIKELLDKINNSFIEFSFIKSPKNFELQIRKEWLKKGYLIIGVKLDSSQSSEKVRKWINNALICSFSLMEQAKNMRILGASREEVDQVPEMNLVMTDGQLLFKITTNNDFIKEDEPLQIFNRTEEEVSQPTALVLYTTAS